MHLTARSQTSLFTNAQAYAVVARDGNVNVTKWRAGITECNHRNVDIGSLSDGLGRKREGEGETEREREREKEMKYHIQDTGRLSFIHYCKLCRCTVSQVHTW